MSYTSADQVRVVLQAATTVGLPVWNQPVRLDATEATQISLRPVDATSVIVKSSEQAQLQRRQIILNAGQAQLGGTHVVRESVVVASDSSLGRIYREYGDYLIDYTSGSLHLKSGSSLDPDDVVTVWFRTHHLYELSTDYALDAEAGVIRRLASGSIGDGELVLVDYTSLPLAFSDSLIEQAVAEANARVQRQTDPERHFGADPILTTAALELSLAALSRSAALRSLSGRFGTEKRTTEWLRLANEYQQSAERLLEDYQPARPGLSRPVHG